MINKEINPNLTAWLAVPAAAIYNPINSFACHYFSFSEPSNSTAGRNEGSDKMGLSPTWFENGPAGLLCSSGCCSQIVSTMGTLLHGDRIPERNRSNFKRQEMQNRYPCYLLTQTFSCNNFNFTTSASVLIGSDFCLTQICHSLQHLTQLLLHLA